MGIEGVVESIRLVEGVDDGGVGDRGVIHGIECGYRRNPTYERVGHGSGGIIDVFAITINCTRY